MNKKPTKPEKNLSKSNIVFEFVHRLRVMLLHVCLNPREKKQEQKLIYHLFVYATMVGTMHAYTPVVVLCLFEVVKYAVVVFVSKA